MEEPLSQDEITLPTSARRPSPEPEIDPEDSTPSAATDRAAQREMGFEGDTSFGLEDPSAQREAPPLRSDFGEPSIPPIPRELPSYVIEPDAMPLGAGAMGEVYPATHRKTKQKVAIKFAPMRRLATMSTLAIERSALARLAHPNILRVLDGDADEHYAWIAIELIEGETLAQRIDKARGKRREPFVFGQEDANEEPRSERIRRAVRWFRDLAQALQAIHDKKLLHRDVKPANIMIARDGRAVLIDFGLALADWRPESLPRGLEGTIPYMSPEQALAGNVGLDERSDVYGLAITFHELLTGERVVPADRPVSERLMMVAQQEVPPPSAIDRRVSKTLDAIFAHALAKQPDDRYASAGKLAEDLDRWLSGRLPRHAPLTPARRIRDAILHHPFLASLASLGLLMLVILAFSSAEGFRKDRSLDEIDDRLRDREPGVALDLLDRRRPELAEEPRFAALCREATRDWSSRALDRLIEQLTLALHRPEDLPWLAEMNRRAERSASLCPAEPGPCSIRALVAMMSEDQAAALALVDRLGTGSELPAELPEIRALVLVAELAEASAPAAAWHRYLVHCRKECRGNPDSLRVACLRATHLCYAYAATWDRPAKCEGSADFDLKREKAFLRAALEKIRNRLVPELDREHASERPGLTMASAKVLIQLGDYAEAAGLIRAVIMQAPRGKNRDGPRVRCAIASILADGLAGRPETVTVDEIANLVGHLLTSDPSVAPHILDRCYGLLRRELDSGDPEAGLRAGMMYRRTLDVLATLLKDHPDLLHPVMHRAVGYGRDLLYGKLYHLAGPCWKHYAAAGSAHRELLWPRTRVFLLENSLYAILSRWTQSGRITEEQIALCMELSRAHDAEPQMERRPLATYMLARVHLGLRDGADTQAEAEAHHQRARALLRLVVASEGREVDNSAEEHRDAIESARERLEELPEKAPDDR